MKVIKKLLAILTVAALVIALGVTAFAEAPANPGKITVTNPVKDDEYTVYKLFDVEYDEGKSYIYSTAVDEIAEAAAASELFEVGEKVNGKFPVALVEGKTAADIVAWLAESEIAALIPEADQKSATASGATLVFDDLKLGYYFVMNTTEDAAKAAVSLTNTTPAAEIIDKNDTAPSAGDDFKSAESTFVGVGETANFSLAFTATNYEVKEGVSKSIVSYKLVDTPTNLDIDADSVAIYVGDSSDPLEEGAYTAEVGDDGVLTISVPWVDEEGAFLYDNGVDVRIEYSAVVTDLDASNSAELGYLVKGAEEPTDITPEDGNEVEIENGSITIEENVDGGSYSFGGDIVDTGKTTEDGGKIFRPALEGETPYDGNLSAGDVVAGLGEGEYTVVVVEPPEGYAPVEIDPISIDEENPDAVAEFIYQAGTILPATGGAGTTVLLILGSFLFIGTAIVLVTKKRMYNEGV